MIAGVSSIRVPERLRASVAALGAAGERWLAGLPDLVASLEADWSVTCGTAFEGGNAAFVAEAVTTDGQLEVLKIALPPGIDGFAPFEQELPALQDADGDPYVRLICHDEERRRMLLERLGRPLASLGWPSDRQIAAITATLGARLAPGRLQPPANRRRQGRVAGRLHRRRMAGPRRALHRAGCQAGRRLRRRAGVAR